MNDLPRNIGGVAGRKEYIGRPQFRGLARPFERYVFAEGFDLFFIKGGNNERRPDRTGGDGIDPDLFLCQVGGQRPGKGDDGAFGG